MTCTLKEMTDWIQAAVSGLNTKSEAIMVLLSSQRTLNECCIEDIKNLQEKVASIEKRVGTLEKQLEMAPLVEKTND